MNDQYHIALGEAITWINAHYRATGIIAGGSIIRGNQHPASDLDIYVIHEEKYRQRIQKYFNRVPCEIFVNNLEQVYKYFNDEGKENRPVSAHIISTGKIIQGGDNNNILQLYKDADEYAGRSPVLTEEKSTFIKYRVTNLFEDATDIIADKGTVQYILDKIIPDVIEYLFLRNQVPLPRVKERLKVLETIEQVTGKQVIQYYRLNDVQLKYELVVSLLQHLFGATGFFEWTSEKEYAGE